MAMSSYEVVKRAIEFGRPDRLPVRMGSIGVDDTHHVGWNQIGPGDRALRESVDEWGCVWVRSEQANMGQIKGHPLADLADMDSFPWPDPHDPRFYEGMEERFAGSEGKYVLTGVMMLLIERMCALHGMEATLADLYLDPTRIEALADRIVEFDLGLIEEISSRFPGRIHGFSFTDDWGSQQALFISPAMWNEFFRPRYERIFDAIHAAGWHVWMHSCGKINAIIEPLIEIGLDVINLEQPRLLGVEELARFRGRLCFNTLCDIQRVLPFASEEELRAEARLLLESLATPEGGFILAEYGEGDAIGVSLERKRLMLEAFLEADPYRRSGGR